jgi:hypothetical protein
MKEEDYTRLTPEQEAFLGEDKKETVLRLGIPRGLRFSIIWTLFFIIIGIVIQSIQTSSFVFKDFFISNYVSWFKSFGNFVNFQEYASTIAFFKSIFGGWYYFFYTGGLIALLWGLLEWIINFQIMFTRKKNIVTRMEGKPSRVNYVEEKKKKSLPDMTDLKLEQEILDKKKKND